MTHDEIADRLEAFIRSRYSISADDPAFTRNVDLYDLGYVDSIGLVELLAFINSSLEVEIEDDDLLSDEFSNIHGIAKIVCRTYTSRLPENGQVGQFPGPDAETRSQANYL